MGLISKVFGGGGGKPKASQHERELARQGARDFNRFLEFLPAVDKFSERIRNKSGDRARIGREASVAAADATAGADRGLGRARGAGAVLATADSADQFATGTAAAGAAGESALHQREIAGSAKLARFGRGQADSARLGLEGLARDATENSINRTKRKIDSAQSTVSGLSSVAGIATSAYRNKTGIFAPDKKAGTHPAEVNG